MAWTVTEWPSACMYIKRASLFSGFSKDPVTVTVMRDIGFMHNVCEATVKGT
jgi:hypothetical protein